MYELKGDSMIKQELPREAKYQGIVMGIPTFGMISFTWTASQLTMAVPIFTNIGYHFVQGKPVDVARNEIAYAAMQNKNAYVLFRDDDTIAPRDAILKLTKRFDAYKKMRPETLGDCIIGGVVYSKTQPPTPMIFREGHTCGIEDWNLNDLLEVDVIGMGCTMIPVGVFKKVEPHVKHYRCVNALCPSGYGEFPPEKKGNCPECNSTLVPGFFKTVRDLNDEGQPAYMTEDSYFCLLAKKVAGIKTLVDCGVQTRHEDWSRNPAETTHYYYHPQAGPVWEQNGMVYTYPEVESEIHDQMILRPRPEKRNGKGPIKLNLGAGKVKKNGYINVDLFDEPEYKCDVRDLTPLVRDLGQVREIRASHVLEHLGRQELLPAFRNWLKALEPGGKLDIEVPDGVWAAKNFVKEMENGGKNEFAEMVVYGQQASPLDFHKSALTEPKFKRIISACRNQIEKSKVETIFPKGYNQQCIRVVITKKKGAPNRAGAKAKK